MMILPQIMIYMNVCHSYTENILSLGDNKKFFRDGKMTETRFEVDLKREW